MLLEFFSESPFLCLYLEVFSSGSLKVLGLIFKSLIYLELIIFFPGEKCLVYFYSLWVDIKFSQHHVLENGCLFRQCMFLHLCRKLFNCSCVGLFMNPLFICLYTYYVPVASWFCFVTMVL